MEDQKTNINKCPVVLMHRKVTLNQTILIYLVGYRGKESERMSLNESKKWKRFKAAIPNTRVCL